MYPTTQKTTQTHKFAADFKLLNYNYRLVNIDVCMYFTYYKCVVSNYLMQQILRQINITGWQVQSRIQHIYELQKQEKYKYNYNVTKNKSNTSITCGFDTFPNSAKLHANIYIYIFTQTEKSKRRREGFLVGLAAKMSHFRDNSWVSTQITRFTFILPNKYCFCFICVCCCMFIFCFTFVILCYSFV